jgi:hypothetical protein
MSECIIWKRVFPRNQTVRAVIQDLVLLEQGYTDFQKSRSHHTFVRPSKVIWKSPNRGDTHIRCHGTKCISPGDLEPRICALLFRDMKLHHWVMKRRRFETNNKYTRNAFLVIRRLKIIALRCVATSGFVYSLTQRHIPEEQYPQLYRYIHLQNCY